MRAVRGARAAAKEAARGGGSRPGRTCRPFPVGMIGVDGGRAMLGCIKHEEAGSALEASSGVESRLELEVLELEQALL